MWLIAKWRFHYFSQQVSARANAWVRITYLTEFLVYGLLSNMTRDKNVTIVCKNMTTAAYKWAIEWATSFAALLPLQPPQSNKLVFLIFVSPSLCFLKCFESELTGPACCNLRLEFCLWGIIRSQAAINTSWIKAHTFLFKLFTTLPPPVFKLYFISHMVSEWKCIKAHEEIAEFMVNWCRVEQGNDRI